MATVTRRYRFVSSTDAKLQALVAPSALVLQEYVNVVDISIDDTTGNPETLDDYMATLGYVFDETAAAYKGESVNMETLPTWEQSGINASQVFTPMKLTGSTIFGSVIGPRPGSLVTMAVQMQTPITAGSLRVAFSINGVNTLAQVTLNSLTPLKTVSFVLQHFTSLDNLGFQVATDAAFAPAANALSVWGEVLWDSSPLAD